MVAAMLLEHRSIRWTLSGALWAACCLAVTGCGSVPGTKESFARGPLPYHVCVFVDREALGFIAGDAAGDPAQASQPSRAARPAESERGGSNGNGGAAVADPAPAPEPEPVAKKIQYTLDAEAFAARVARAISSESGAVTLARVLEAPNRPDALRIAQGVNADLLIAVGFETRPEYTDRSWSPGWGVLEIGSWLFGGIPSWFVPSLEFSTLSRLKIEVVDLHQRSPGEHAEPETAWKEDFNAPYQTVSLWDRSYPFDRPLDYLATIVVPPVVMNPGDPERVSQELTDDLTSELNDQFAVSLRNRLIESEKTALVSIGFLTPDPSRPVKADSIRLRVGIASRGPARVAALDLHRFVSGAEKFRWVMPKADVESLAKRLEELDAKGEYAELDVPDEIPIVAGENIVKLRVLRDDGLIVTRTMVYRK